MRLFSIETRVYYQHTDAGGVVFHANYLAFMEAARTELLYSYGFDLAELASRDGVLFIVHRAELKFEKPARLNDLLSVTAEIERIGLARLIFLQRVLRGPDRLVAGRIQLACVHPESFRPVPVPEAVRAKLAAE